MRVYTKKVKIKTTYSKYKRALAQEEHLQNNAQLCELISVRR
jgi:hypothetical protein